MVVNSFRGITVYDEGIICIIGMLVECMNVEPRTIANELRRSLILIFCSQSYRVHEVSCHIVGKNLGTGAGTDQCFCREITIQLCERDRVRLDIVLLPEYFLVIDSMYLMHITIIILDPENSQQVIILSIGFWYA